MEIRTMLNSLLLGRQNILCTLNLRRSVFVQDDINDLIGTLDKTIDTF